jgi:hypothetical protein
MTPGSPWQRLSSLAFLLLAAWAIAGYDAVENPEPLGRLLLVAGWLAWFTLAALGAGLPLWRAATGTRPDDGEGWLLVLAAGAAGLAALAGLLSLAGWLRPAPLLTLLVLAAAGGGAQLWRASDRAGFADRCDRANGWALPTVLAGGVTLLIAASPSPFYDQLHYHLAFPFQWLRAGEIFVYPRQFYSYFPSNMGLLYSYALAGPGAWAAQVLHWWMGALTVGGVYFLARRLGSGSSWMAAAVFAATPAVMLSATWAGSDLTVAAYGLASLCMMVRALGFSEPEAGARPGWWLLAGALAGFAAGCKYLALASVVLPLGAALVAGAASRVVVDRARWNRIVGTGLLWGAGLSVFLAPWLLRNLWATGNPFFPFLTDLFPAASPEVQAVAERIGSSANPGDTALRALTLRTFSPRGHGGAIGPAYLGLLGAWLLRLLTTRTSRRERLLAVFSVTGVILWGRFPQLGRYLLPVLAPALAGAALAWDQIRSSWSRPIARLLTALLAILILWGALGGISPLGLNRLGSTLGRNDPEELMTRYASYWPAVRFLNDELPEDAKLLLVAESRTMYVERELVVEDPFHLPLLVELAEKASGPAAMARELEAMGVTHVLFNRHEADRMATSGGREDYFSQASPDAASRLRRFLATCLQRVHSAPPVEVFELGRCDAEGPAR